MTTHRTPSFTYDAVHLLPDEQIGVHEQTTWELSYVCVGSGVRVIGEQEEAFDSGEVIFIPPNIPHCWNFDPEVTDAEGRIANITLTFGDDFLERCMLAFPELEDTIACIRSARSAMKLRQEEAEEVIRILEAMRPMNDLQRLPQVLQLFLVLGRSGKHRVVGRYRKMDKGQKRLDEVRTYVVCNFRRNISLDDVARHVGMNRAAFCVFFKQATGKTFIAYLNEYRVKIACRLLRQGKLSISEVGYHAGFNSAPYFNRIFKRVRGVTPGEYFQTCTEKRA
ncbi:MAG: helix-turn-helix domain-containing protein [Bacteroides sp.]|nr:helix-turn-helix domain-containing protein [Bacteroides sp.]